MKINRVSVVIMAMTLFEGCITFNPTPNDQGYGLTDAQAKAAQFNAMQTEMMDREAHKARIRDEAEVRAWENNISNTGKSNILRY